MRIFRAEVLKLVSLRTTWLLIGAMVLIEGLYAVTFAGAADLESIDTPTDLFVGTSIQTVLVFCLGTFIITNEFRHGTANSTFLITPRREQVIVAKLLVGLLVGIACALLFIAVNAGFGYSVLSSRDVQIDGGRAVDVYVGVGVGIVLTCVFGVGIGALLRNQVAAVVAGLVIFFVLRGIAALLGEVGAFFPADALIGLQGGTFGTDDTLDDQVAAGLVFLAYCVAVAVAGTIATREREIT